MSNVPVLVLYAMVLAIVALAVGYLGRFEVPRPPVGRFVGSDILIMAVVLVVMPFAYLALPNGVLIAVFGIVVFSATQLTLSPLLGGRYAALAGLVLCGLPLAAHAAGWDVTMLVANDLAVAVLTVGFSNMWVQAAMKAGHVAWLAAALTVYDTLATGVFPVTSDFVNRVVGIPFAPLLATRYGDAPVFIGLGDCLMLALWPLVAAKTYGRAARWGAIAVDVLVLAAMFAGGVTGVIDGVFPVLTLLGPLIVAQYLFWRRRRTAVRPGRASLTANLRTVQESLSDRYAPGTWVALHEGEVVGTGPTAGTACRAALRAGVTETPVTILITG
ncbi:hypothetical protein [Nonomuraea sp. NPDC049309]|uniref:hypothetical protein n=1 Tax=Nonomuraea sp. NPDC049309 TaxID=3364350 RepID=UPI003717FD4D